MAGQSPAGEVPLSAAGRVEVRGVEVQLYRGGAGVPLLWLHGAGGGGWLPVHARLAGRFEVFVPDHLGFGRSGDAPWLEGVDDLVFHYLDLVDALGLRQAHLVGHSLGGWVAAELAILHPRWLRSLTLIDAAGLSVPEAPLPDLFVLSPEERRALGTYRDPTGPAASAALERPEPPAREPDDDESLRIQARNHDTFARLAWQPYLHDPKLRRRLHRIQVPTLVLWGEGDRLIPPAYGEVYAREIAGARLLRVPRAGHAPQRDAAASVAAAIESHCG